MRSTSFFPKDPANDGCYSSVPSAHVDYPNGTSVETHYSRLCIGSSYPTVCVMGLDEANLNFVCTEDEFVYGYNVQPKDFEDKLFRPTVSTGITNIECPESFSFFDPSMCSYDVSHDHCESNGGPSIISCVYQEGKGSNSHLKKIVTTINYLQM